MNHEDLADAAVLPLKEVRRGMELLQGLRLVTWDESKNWWFIPKWDQRQFESSYSREVIPDKVRSGVFARDNYECVECGTGDDLTIDHIVPLTKDGTNDENNLQTLCRSCNTKKGNRLRQRDYRSRAGTVTRDTKSDVTGTPPETEADTDTEPPPVVPPKGDKPKRGSRIPDGWKPNAILIEWALEEFPDVDLVAETEKFTDHFTATGKPLKDWNAAWRNWIRRSQDFKRVTA